MKKISMIAVFFCFLGMTATAQFSLPNRIKLVNGGFAFLKGATELNVQFNYDNLKVGDLDEVDYMVKHMAELDKAKAGSGEEWKKKWNGDRTAKYEPAFMKTFAKRLTKLGIVAAQNKTGAKYTVIIKTTKIEQGVYTGISYAQKDAFIDVTAQFVETANPGTVLAEVSGVNFTGKETFDAAARVTYSYTSWGNSLGAFVVGQVKKIK